MKSTFLYLLFTAVANELTGGGNAAGTPVELTSDKLTELKASRKAAWAEMLKHEDPDTAEALAAKQAVWKIDGEIAAEKQAMKKAVNDAKIQEARNERLKMNENQFTAYDALKAILADKKATDEQKAAAQTAFDTAKELVNNALLGSMAAKPKAAKTDGEQSEGSKSEQKAAILELYKAGKKHSEIEAAGYARSTVWHVIDKAIKAGEVEKLH